MISRRQITRLLLRIYPVPSFIVFVFFTVLMSYNLSSAFNVKEISAPELKRLIDGTQDFLVINVLSEIEYAMQHIPESINIPINTIELANKLPKDKNMTLVFYCLSER